MFKAFGRQFFLFAMLVTVPVGLAIMVLPGSLAKVFSSENFMPHAHCYLNDPRMIWLHGISDFLIGASYVAISSGLGYLVYKARHDIPFSWMFLAFGLFIISCGGTHFMEVWTIHHPTYWLAGHVKLLTAVASVATAVAFPMILPNIFGLIQTAKASEERKRKLEEAHGEMERMNRQLRELDELKSRFFANVSHELRTPLTLILGPTEKLLASVALSPSEQGDVRLIRRNAQVLLRHVNDLLDASKLEAGKLGIHYQRGDFASLVRIAAANFEGVAAEKSIRFVVECPPALMAEFDAEKCERVIANLLSNAFKFTPDGGTIRCTLAQGERESILSVADSGPGVPVEFRPKVFDRFEQADSSATRARGGTGLGLAIAREFVVLHGGSITVGEAAEGGALFTVRLPQHAPEGATVSGEQAQGQTSASAIAAAELAPVAAEQPVTATPRAEGDALVLVVEDNPEMSRFVRDLLSPDYHIETATDGRAGLAAAQRLRPDLIISDNMMPEMSGEELLHALRADPALAETPVMFLTARGDDESRARLLREGAQDYLVKPFSPEELRARTSNLLVARTARAVLQRTNKELEAFSFSLSHDMRAPLRAMQNFAAIVVEDYGEKLDETGRDYLRRIVTASARLDQLIRDVLSYTQVSHGAMTLRPVDVQQVIQEVIADRPELKRPQAEISVSGPLPKVLGHAASLTQCVANLLGNAVKYVAPGTQPRVRIHAEQRGGRVRIWFEDNGIGIPPEHHARVFQIFERVHSGERAYEGSGLGLAIVRRSVERMQGKVGVESTPGQGSRFWIELRAAE